MFLQKSENYSRKILQQCKTLPWTKSAKNDKVENLPTKTIWNFFFLARSDALGRVWVIISSVFLENDGNSSLSLQFWLIIPAKICGLK